MVVMINTDPQIKIEDALSFTDGNQAELARRLGITRANVSLWIAQERDHMPELQAHRFVKIFAKELRKRK